ncbi:MAG: hypothetical protein KJ901_18960, partial [Gammaproteobacteria bacterium]|nr:hypothetical protein [Gammaproteobacteria bacterium]
LTFAAVRRVLAVQDAGAARGHRAAPVVACLNDRTAEAAETNGRWPPGVALFDIFARCFSRSQPYPAADADARARRVNNAHQGQPWDALSDRFRWSSRLAADHMDVKLALLGLSPHDSDLPRALRARMQSDESMRWLTRLEHRRFVVERLIEGWLLLDRPSGHPHDAPSGMRYAGQDGEWTQKRFLDLNDTLVPFDELPEETADIDRSIVEAMIECFEAERSTRPSA